MKDSSCFFTTGCYEISNQNVSSRLLLSHFYNRGDLEKDTSPNTNSEGIANASLDDSSSDLDEDSKLSIWSTYSLVEREALSIAKLEE